MKYIEALKKAETILNTSQTGLTLGNNETKTILSSVMKCSKESIYVKLRDKMPFFLYLKFMKSVKKRAKGTPLQYITGEEEFFGRNFKVAGGVLIPRPDTEALVKACLDNMQHMKDIYAIELGTGSGIVPVTLALESKNLSKILSIDTNRKAYKLSKINSRMHGTENVVDLVNCDYFTYIRNTKNKYNLIVSNPPYISPDDMKTLQKEVKKEPADALKADNNGYAVYERLAATSGSILAEKGIIAVETGDNMKENVILIFEQHGFKAVQVFKDDNGLDRAIVFSR